MQGAEKTSAREKNDDKHEYLFKIRGRLMSVNERDAADARFFIRFFFWRSHTKMYQIKMKREMKIDTKHFCERAGKISGCALILSSAN